MAYMMQVSGLWLENSETVKMFRPHLFRSSSSFDSSSSLSVLTPKREMLLLEREGPWETFLTPLICVISCCFCCFFFSRVLDIGDGISTSFCLSVEELNHGLILVQCQKNMLFFCHFLPDLFSSVDPGAAEEHILRFISSGVYQYSHPFNICPFIPFFINALSSLHLQPPSELPLFIHPSPSLHPSWHFFPLLPQPTSSHSRWLTSHLLPFFTS